MQHKIPRRSFLLAWLGGLLAGWLGRSKTHAATTHPTPNPIHNLSYHDGTPDHVATCTYDASGRLLQKVEDGQVTTFTYDATNRE